MKQKKRDGRDEMNLAVLPIARLGRNDTRDVIEYYGTFHDGEKQRSMVWTVRGAAGLPTEFAERVLVALLYIGAQDDFSSRRMEFTPYQILKVLDRAINGRNYKVVEEALTQLAGVLVTSDNAWIEKQKDGSQKRITTKRGFHIIDEFYLRYSEDDDGEGDGEGENSYIVWGSKLWKNLQSGYIRRLDVEFYYSIENSIARRLFRFLDKVTHYKPHSSYAIDVFDLANKLGLVQYQYASQVKRLLGKAADELIERGYLAEYEFFKVGKHVRVRFCRISPVTQLGLFEDIDGTNKDSADPDPWLDMIAEMSANIADNLKGTELVSIEDGVATISAGKGADWLNNRVAKSVARELKLSGHAVEEVVFVE